MTYGARRTPYEVAFPADPFESDVFPSIAAEADARDVSTAVAEDLLMLGTAGQQLRGLRPESDDVDEPEGLPPAEAVREYGALLFQAFRFWREGRPLLTVDEPLLRALAAPDRALLGTWTLTAPQPAGYIEMPRQLVWARIREDAPAEAVDGFFWSVHDGNARRPGRLDILLVMGMHPARPGFSVAEVAAPLPAPPPGHWGDISVRPESQDFGNVLPGGELRDLLALTSGSETLKLASRIFHYISQWPDSIGPTGATVVDETGSAPDPDGSALPARPVRLLGQEH